MVLLAPSAIVENSSVVNFEIYPNPNQGIFQIRLENKENIETLHLEILDITNKVVANKEFNCNGKKMEQSVNLTEIAKGFYTIHCWNLKNINITKRIIIE
jgi:Secretion system C-terminal sorting domain